MSATIDRTTTTPKRVLMVVANPATSTTTGWPVGFTVTGFANVEEAAADDAVTTTVMPWHIQDALRERGANYVDGGLWKAFAIRDGRLITGQQQYSGRKVAALVIEALGV